MEVVSYLSTLPYLPACLEFKLTVKLDQHSVLPHSIRKLAMDHHDWQGYPAKLTQWVESVPDQPVVKQGKVR